MKTKKTFSVLTACFKCLTVLLALSVTQTACAQSSGGKTVPGSNLADKLTWLQANAESDGKYILEVRANESFAPYEFSYGGRNNVTITFKGVGANRAISLASDGSMFTVGSGFTLVLETITLYGRSNNNAPLVNVDKNGTLVMNNGSAVSGNNRGGVSVNGGTFTMNGGTISGNTSVGVFVDKGTFTMSGGAISGNTSVGVYAAGTFTMNGGTISGNSGIGVLVDGNATFTMSGGTISGNTYSGVWVMNGTFTMSGGEISGNTAGDGGGVQVGNAFGLNATFTMSGGTISSNTASNAGGGVYVSSGTFTMNNGEISGNTASRGGGVYAPNATFIPNGGTVSGNTPDDVR